MSQPQLGGVTGQLVYKDVCVQEKSPKQVEKKKRIINHLLSTQWKLQPHKEPVDKHCDYKKLSIREKILPLLCERRLTIQ